jgi:hypothetical protein
LYKSIQKISKDIEFIKEYIISQTKDEYSIDRCKQILQEKKIITTADIENDTILKTKYHQRDTQNKLLSELLESDNDLKQIQTGRGNKRYVFNKKDEGMVINQIRINRVNQKTKINRGEYEYIKTYFQNYQKPSISVIDAHDKLRKDFNIKDKHKRRRYLRDLKDEHIIKGIHDSKFFFKEVD